MKTTKIPPLEEIREAVRKKYAEVSQSAAGRFQYPTGRAGAEALGYDRDFLRDLPEDILESFCGVGNPFLLGPVDRGEHVLDIGSGAGFDLIVASRLVGREGRVCGIDITQEMAEKARESLKRMGATNTEIRVAGAEEIPYGDDAFDLVISNGVLNLSPQKEKSFREIHRVLKPGGRLQFADIILKQELPSDTANNLDAWSD